MAKKTFIVSIIIFCIFISYSYSNEFSGFYSLTGGYDSNPLINTNSLESAILQNTLGLGYNNYENGFSSNYKGSVVSFLNIAERNYQTHNLSFDYIFQPFNYPYFDIKTSALGSLRSNSIDGLLYNNFEINPKLSLILFSDIGIVNFDYSPSFSRFCNYPSLSNSQNEFIIELDKTFEFESNLKVGAIYGFRNYYNSKNTFRNISISENDERKFMYFRKISNQRELPNSMYINQITNILNLYFVISQPIISGFELGLIGNYNLHLNDDGMYYSTGAIDLYNESDFFDDKYNFNEKSIGISTSIKPINNIEINATYKIFNRDFLYPLSLIDYNYSSTQNREDSGHFFSSEIKYIITKYYSIFNKISINLKIDYLRNNSNLKEYTFNFHNILVSMVLEI